MPCPDPRCDKGWITLTEPIVTTDPITGRRVAVICRLPCMQCTNNGHAAPLGGKRLLALWNALLGVAKRRRVGDREAPIDQLWSAIERLPNPEPRPDPKRPSKQDLVIAMLRQPEGATVYVNAMEDVAGDSEQPVRGAYGELRALGGA